jgi:hypothetical protein
MAAGLGFKTFNTGDVLSAADVNGYLMQGVLVFADATARDAAITSPQEGQFAYTKDTNGLWYYSGSAWVASGATGDIEGVTAGTGISGGGTSGTVTITNSMATAIDAKGDLIGGTGADTFSRLAVGANGTVLTADSAEATGLKWVAAAGGSTFVGATVYNTDPARQTISNATVTQLTFNTDEIDTDAFHDTSSNTSRFTVPSGKAGVYRFSAKVANGASTAGVRQLRMYKNGTYNTYLVEQSLGSAGAFYGGEYIINLAVSDYLEIYAYQNSGGNLLIDTGRDVAQISFTYLGA